jgi:hypothetical protein
MEPERLLLCNERVCRLCSEPKERGREEVSWLSLRSNVMSFDRDPMEEGMKPIRELLDSSRVWRVAISVTVLGRVPDRRALLVIESVVK